MNSLQFDVLKTRIISRLQTRGAATSENLAVELDSPPGNIQLALEQLSSAEEKTVRRLPFGFWDITVEAEEAA